MSVMYDIYPYLAMQMVADEKRKKHQQQRKESSASLNPLEVQIIHYNQKDLIENDDENNGATTCFYKIKRWLQQVVTKCKTKLNVNGGENNEEVYASDKYQQMKRCASDANMSVDSVDP
ncbi:hypothetical protein ABK040_008713 [Willaertia magna]